MPALSDMLSEYDINLRPFAVELALPYVLTVLLCTTDEMPDTIIIPYHLLFVNRKGEENGNNFMFDLLLCSDLRIV